MLLYIRYVTCFVYVSTLYLKYLLSVIILMSSQQNLLVLVIISEQRVGPSSVMIHSRDWSLVTITHRLGRVCWKLASGVCWGRRRYYCSKFSGKIFSFAIFAIWKNVTKNAFFTSPAYSVEVVRFTGMFEERLKV